MITPVRTGDFAFYPVSSHAMRVRNALSAAPRKWEDRAGDGSAVLVVLIWLQDIQ